MDNENKTEKKNSPKRILLIALIAFAALAIVASIFIGVSIYRSYVLYPRIDKALANALEPKLDLGTKFDARDMIRQGSSEFLLKDVGGAKEIGGGVNYGKKGATAYISADGERIDAILTRQGIAISADGVGGEGYYGIEFGKIGDEIDKSFLNPENGSEYAMAKQKYEELRTLVFQLEEVANSKAEYADSARVLLDAFAKAHEASPLYTEEHLRGEMIINGESRAARGVVYSFDHKSLTGYLEALAEIFAAPDEELRAATERLICSGILKYEFERFLDRELSGCEDVANTLKSLTRLINVLFGGSDWSGKISVAYVKNAISAVELSIEMKKLKIHALADFGVDPTKDKSMIFVFDKDILDSTGNFIRSKQHVVEYDVKIAGKQTRAELSYAVCEEVSDGTLDKETDLFVFELDRKGGNARIALENRVEYYHPWATETTADRRESIIDKSFEIKDGYSSIKLVASDRSQLVLSRRAKRVSMPDYENILNLEIGRVDTLLDEFCEKYKWLVEYIEKSS